MGRKKKETTNPVKEKKVRKKPVKVEEPKVEGTPELPVEVEQLPLEAQTQNIVDKMIQTNNTDDLKNLTNLFNIAQMKKNALRVIKLTNLMDKVEDQAIERFEKHPDEMSHKDIQGYMQIVQNQIDRANQVVNQVDQKPLITVNNNTQEIKVTVAGSRESDERVRDAIDQLLKLASQPQQKPDEISVKEDEVPVIELNKESNDEE